MLDIIAIALFLSFLTMAGTQWLITTANITNKVVKTGLALPISGVVVALWNFGIYRALVSILRILDPPTFGDVPVDSPSVPEGMGLLDYAGLVVLVWFQSIGFIKLGVFNNRRKTGK